VIKGNNVSKSNDDKIYIDEFNRDYSQLQRAKIGNKKKLEFKL